MPLTDLSFISLSDHLFKPPAGSFHVSIQLIMHHLKWYCFLFKGQPNYNLCWNTLASMPALHPMQESDSSGVRGVTYPRRATTVPIGLLGCATPQQVAQIQEAWGWSRLCGKWIKMWQKCWVLAPSPAPCLPLGIPTACLPHAPACHPPASSSPSPNPCVGQHKPTLLCCPWWCREAGTLPGWHKGLALLRNEP